MRPFWMLVVVLACVASTVHVSTVPAAANVPILVTTTLDVINSTDGVVSFREAVIAANAQAGADEVVLGTGLTYTLTICSGPSGNNNSGPLVALASITITGNGSTVRQVCAARGALYIGGPSVVSNVAFVDIPATESEGAVVGGGPSANESAVLDHVSVVNSAGSCIGAPTGGYLVMQSVLIDGCALLGIRAFDANVHVLDSDITNVFNEDKRIGALVGGDLTLTRTEVHHNVNGVFADRLTMNASSLDHNAGESAVALVDELFATDSSISNNTSSSTWAGALATRTLELVRSTVSGNEGLQFAGAIAGMYGNSAASTVSVIDSTVADNVATFPFPGTDLVAAGLMVNDGSGDTTISGSTIRGNRADGVAGLYVGGAGLTLERSSIVDNVSTPSAEREVAGAAVVRTATFGSNISGTTIAGNTVTGVPGREFVGGLDVEGWVTIDASTVSGNTGDVGGIRLRTSDLLRRELWSVTVADNVGSLASNLWVDKVLEVKGTVFGLSGGDGPSCVVGPGAEITSLGSNFDVGDSCGVGAGGGDVENGGDPLLGGLADNGGSTMTRLPSARSPLVDRATWCGPEQRGMDRPVGPACDFGSVEGSAGAGFHPLTPARLLDSRTAVGGWATTPLTAAAPRALTVTGGSVPASASAVVLNVTATASSAPAFLTVWPAGVAQPTASNLNFDAGQTIPNLVTVKVGAGGQVLFATSAGQTEVVADLVGYFDDGTGPGDRFNALAPARLLDSRTDVGGWASSKLTAGTPRDLIVRGRGGVPLNASAVVVNVTATNATTGSFLKVFPSGALPPGVSNLNFAAGQTIPNLVVVKVGFGGAIRFANALGSTDVIVDVLGWFEATNGAKFHPVTPTRFLDDRVNLGATGPWGPGQARPVHAPGARMTAIVTNVTATNATHGSFVTAFPTEPAPTSSNLNFGPGQTIPNLVMVPLSANQFRLRNEAGSVDLIADLVGYYTTP